MPRLVLLVREPVLMKSEMPVHVDDEHIKWHIVLTEAANEIFELLIAVGPVPRPPRTKGESRGQGNLPGDSGEISERLFVVVTIAEKVPILTISLRTLHHPRPRAVFPLCETEIVGIEERTRGIVHQRPSIARDESRTDRFARLAAERAIECACCSH